MVWNIQKDMWRSWRNATVLYIECLIVTLLSVDGMGYWNQHHMDVKDWLLLSAKFKFYSSLQLSIGRRNLLCSFSSFHPSFFPKLLLSQKHQKPDSHILFFSRKTFYDIIAIILPFSFIPPNLPLCTPSFLSNSCFFLYLLLLWWWCCVYVSVCW